MTIAKSIMGTYRRNNSQNRIYINKPSFLSVIISIPQIIQPRLLVVRIPPIPKRIQFGQRFICSCQGTHEHGLAPRIVLVFYHEASGAVNDPRDVALEVVDIAIQRAVEVDHRGSALRIVEEVHLIASPGQMRS